MTHLNNCLLCNSENLSFFIRSRDHFLSKEDFNLYKCQDCGFIFTQDHPDESDIKKYYESGDYISHDNNTGGFAGKIYRFARTIMLKRKRKLIARITSVSKGKLLDIGSGTGHFAWTMKKAGWEVTGIEPNEKARYYGITRFGLNMVSPDQLSIIPDSSFDCITLWHVLEHLHDPFKYASEIRRLLSSGGFCIAAMPNCDSIDSAYYSNFWAAYDVPRHLWHFNPNTFKLFAEKSGFEIINILNLPIDSFYISFLSEKNKGSKLPFVKGIITALWFSLKSMTEGKGKSSSLIYILRKKDDQ